MQDSDSKSRDDGGRGGRAVLDLRQAQRLGRFALRLNGDALQPHYRNGDVLHVESDATPEPGAFIIALAAHRGQSETGSTSCGTVEAMQINGDGDLSNNRGTFIERGAYHLLGVVTGKQ